MTTPIEALEIVENLIRRDPACFNLSDELQSVRAVLRSIAASLEGDAVERVARTDFARRCRAYLDDMPSDGRHSDAAGSNAYELIEEAIEHCATGLVAGEAAIRAKAFEEAAKIVTSRVEGMELQRFVFNGVTSTDTRGNDLFIAKSDVEKLLNDRAATIRSQEAGR